MASCLLWDQLHPPFGLSASNISPSKTYLLLLIFMKHPIWYYFRHQVILWELMLCSCSLFFWKIYPLRFGSSPLTYFMDKLYILFPIRIPCPHFPPVVNRTSGPSGFVYVMMEAYPWDLRWRFAKYMCSQECRKQVDQRLFVHYFVCCICCQNRFSCLPANTCAVFMCGRIEHCTHFIEGSG
jgi:hypothetical protein